MDRSRALLAMAIVCLLAAPVPARAATATVVERGTDFTPKQIDVKAGDTVVWIYESGPRSEGHGVKFDNGPDLSPGCAPGLLGGTTPGCQDRTNPTVQRTFTTPGTFPYQCKIHGNQGMVGVVVVSPVGSTSSTAGDTTSSTLPRATTTSSTARSSSTSSTTATTRQLATSSTLVKSTTTTADSTSVLLPGDAPSFDDANSNAAGGSGGSDGGNDSGTVALIVAGLLAVGVGGGFLLWRLRPGRA
jgi:plastocyanin